MNSILDADLRRIRKPCEARAGHGLIFFLIALSLLGAIVYVIVLVARKLFSGS